MSANEGLIDRSVCFAIRLAPIACAIPLDFALTGQKLHSWIGVIPLATAIFGFCPWFTVLGISAYPSKRVGVG